MRSESEVLQHLVNWAQAETNVRALILNGSRAGSRARVDFLSDYDVVLYVHDWHSFKTSDQWLDNFGVAMIRFPLRPGPTFDEQYLTRLVLFEDGLRIDFQITESRQIAPRDYDNGYRVLLDKDGLADSLHTPSYTEFNVTKPLQAEFDELMNEFWWDFTYVPKQLVRNELPFAKYMLDCLLRQTYLHRLIDWFIGSQHDWQVNPGYQGKWYQRYLDDATWLAYTDSFAGADIEENWTALFRVGELFGHLGEALAIQLGYSYPKALDNKITRYAATLRQTSNQLKR